MDPLFVGSESLFGFYRFSSWVCEEEPGLAFGGGNLLDILGNSSAPKIIRSGILMLGSTASMPLIACRTVDISHIPEEQASNAY